MLLPSNVEMSLYQKFKQRHDHNAENEEQAELPAMLMREHWQAVMVHVVAQQDVAVVVGERPEHVVVIVGRLDEHAVRERPRDLLWRDREADAQPPAGLDGILVDPDRLVERTRAVRRVDTLAELLSS